MIHTLFVSPQTEPEELKKQMRKKLMTGGAVVRLAPELTSGDLDGICAKFKPIAERFSVAAEVLIQAVKHPSLDPEQETDLRMLNLPELTRALDERALAQHAEGA